MVKLEDFTNKELINVISKWIESDPDLKPFEIARHLRSGAWLDDINLELVYDFPHHNS